MTDFIEWLAQQVGETERCAHAVLGADGPERYQFDAEHRRLYKAQLAACAAVRAVLDRIDPVSDCDIAMCLGLMFADHDGYRPEWAPDNHLQTSLSRGLEQARTGNVHSAGSFAEYLNDGQ